MFEAYLGIDQTGGLAGDPDLCDAAVLAVMGAVLDERGTLFTPFAGFTPSREGWICGLDKS